MSHLVSSTLGSLCLLVTDGTHDSPQIQSSGVPFIKAKHISNGFVDFDTCDFITYKDHLKVIARSKPEKGDILFTHIGASLGVTAYINAFVEFSIKNVALFKPHPDRVDSRYLYYLVISSQFQKGILSRRTGSAQPFVSLDTLRGYEVNYHPEIAIQRKIAAILSGYDDLIENNTRRIKILEEMARSLYREWFVSFRFPGHEQVKIIDSELGVIPEGWSFVSFTDIVDVLSGGTPKTKIFEYWNGAIPFFTPKDAPSSFYVTETEKNITELGLKKCNSKLYPKNTVFITARGTVGKAAMTASEMAMNQSCFALRGKNNINQYFVFLTIINYVEQLKKDASGATFDAIIIDTFCRLRVIKPSLILINKFGALIYPIFEQVLNLMNKNANLCQTRDLLLPKLISGEIDLESLDIINLGELAA